MNEERDVVVTDTNEDMDLDLNLDDSEDVGALKEEIARLKEAKRQIHARALRAEKEKKAPINNEFSINDEVVDLRLDGYTKDEVAFILKNGGRKTLEDKNSYVSIAINARKEQARAEAEANKVVDTSGLSEVERKYTPDMMKNMSLDELKKIVPKA
jgi:hypothetical protein